MKFHIGKLVEDQIRLKGMTKIALARRVKASPQVINGLVKRPSMDTDMLQKISVALQYDFFTHFTDNRRKSIAVADQQAVALLQEISELRRQIDVLSRHNGYLRELLELHNSLGNGKKVQLQPKLTKNFPPIHNNKQVNQTKKKTRRKV